MFIAGGPPKRAVTELWNNSSWTEVADLATGRSAPGGAGTTTAGIAIGGETDPGRVTTTEEFTSPASATVTFDVS